MSRKRNYWRQPEGGGAEIDGIHERALQLLRLGSNREDASFREGQFEAISHLVEGRGRLLVVQRTGWGKSFVYFIATKLLRDRGQGPALLVSPLLALMRNQLQAAWKMGVRAEAIHSDNKEEWDEVEEKVRQGVVDILLVSPERLVNERFQSQVMSQIGSKASMLIVDEAHCISDWGHDFRPQYRQLERVVRNLPRGFRLLATTATANQRVIDDLHSVLGPDLHVIRGDLNRPSLSLQTIHLPEQADRMAWLAQNIPHLPGSGIVYALTVRDAEQISEWLRSWEIPAKAYTGQSDNRKALEEDLIANRVKVLVATTALGMGFDKPDLGFVIHYQSPGSVVAYYQQVGRAGRAVETARGVLLIGKGDQNIHRYFIDSAFPTRENVEQLLSALDKAHDGLTSDALARRVGLEPSRTERTLNLLSLESPAPIVKEGTRWQLGLGTVSESFWERVARDRRGAWAYPKPDARVAEAPRCGERDRAEESSKPTALSPRPPQSRGDAGRSRQWRMSCLHQLGFVVEYSIHASSLAGSIHRYEPCPPISVKKA